MGVTMSAIFTEEISAVNGIIAEKLGKQKYRVWFKNSTKFTLTDEHLKIGIPNHFIGSWIENHFLETISQAVIEATGQPRKIIFSIDPTLINNQRRSQLDTQARDVSRERNKTTRSRIKQIKSAAPSLRLQLETFVVGSCNELAYNAAKAVVNQQQSPFNPLFFHSGYGLGKTHLLQGICNEFSKKNPSSRWIYVSAEEFANHFVLALKTQKLDAFRKKFRQADLLAIDDIHFLAGKTSMQEEFLHTFNSIDLAGKQIVLASDAHPKMIGQLCDKLVNRFVSGMVVKIETPDLDTRSKICRQCAKSMGKKLSNEVIEYIATRMHTNIRELEGALLKLIAYCCLNGRDATVETAKEVLAEHISRTDPIVHVSDINAAVSAYFGITTADIHSSKKDRTVSLARSYSMYLARNYTKLSYPEIGKVMGGKNHATVILACRKIEDLIERNAEIKWRSQNGNRIDNARKTLNKLIESISSPKSKDH
jgi:chromosomal replication initiator protein